MSQARQLLAIMFTDIEGYTALMQKSEAVALEFRDQHRKIFESTTSKYHGVVVHYYGDGTLSYFQSSLDAVQCAIEMQKQFLAETDIPMRIGIHMGDVVVTEDDIVGDAVNLASRVESLGIPGSVLVSGRIVEDLKGHRHIQTKSMGLFHFKNDAKPREIFAIKDTALVLPRRNQLKGKTYKTTSVVQTMLFYVIGAWLFIQLSDFIIAKQDWDPVLIDLIIVLSFFGLVATFTLARFRPRYGWLSFGLLAVNAIIAVLTLGSFINNPTIAEPSRYRILKAFNYDPPPLEESLKSLAVLPFSNYTGDENQDYLYAGMHDGLISEISILSGINVTSHTSSMSYAGTSKSLKQIAEELDVEAIIEATLTRVDTIVELRIKLVEVLPREQTLWSHDYHTSINDVPNLYKEVTKNVALQINGVLQPKELQLLSKVKPGKPGAFEAYLKGQFYAGLLTPEGLEEARKYFEQAIEIDPEFALGYGGLSLVWVAQKQMGMVSPELANPEIRQLLGKAMKLDSLNPENWIGVGAVSTWTDFNWQKGEEGFQRSLEIHPKNAVARATYAHLLLILNRFNEAEAQMDIAEAIDPLNPWVLSFGGITKFYQGKLLSAAKRFEMLRKLEPNHPMLSEYLLGKYINTRQFDLAVEQLKNFIRTKTDQDRLNPLIDESYAQVGFSATIQMAASELEKASRTTFVASNTIMRLYEYIGDKEKRLYWLEKMYEQGDPNLPYYGIKTNDPIQQDSSYVEIMRKLELW